MPMNLELGMDCRICLSVSLEVGLRDGMILNFLRLYFDANYLIF